jgi:hypothetical protein
MTSGRDRFRQISSAIRQSHSQLRQSTNKRPKETVPEDYSERFKLAAVDGESNRRLNTSTKMLPRA